MLPICAAHREELRGTARRNVVHRKVLALPCLRLDGGFTCRVAIVLSWPGGSSFRCLRAGAPPPVDVVDDRRVDGPTPIAIASWLSLSEV